MVNRLWKRSRPFCATAIHSSRVRLSTAWATTAPSRVSSAKARSTSSSSTSIAARTRANKWRSSGTASRAKCAPISPLSSASPASKRSASSSALSARYTATRHRPPRGCTTSDSARTSPAAGSPCASERSRSSASCSGVGRRSALSIASVWRTCGVASSPRWPCTWGRERRAPSTRPSASYATTTTTAATTTTIKMNEPLTVAVWWIKRLIYGDVVFHVYLQKSVRIISFNWRTKERK